MGTKLDKMKAVSNEQSSVWLNGWLHSTCLRGCLKTRSVVRLETNHANRLNEENLKDQISKECFDSWAVYRGVTKQDIKQCSNDDSASDDRRGRVTGTGETDSFGHPVAERFQKANKETN